jgi:hypothetical protein
MKAALLILSLALSLHAEERFLLAADNQVIEINRAGKVTDLLKHPGHGGIYDAWRLPDGGIAYAHRGGLAVFDAAKKLVLDHKARAGSQRRGGKQLRGARRRCAVRAHGQRRLPDPHRGSQRCRRERNTAARSQRRCAAFSLSHDPRRAGENAFWVGQYGRKTLLKVETKTGKLLQSIALDPLLKPTPTVKKAFAMLQPGDGSLFVATSTGCQLLHIDAAGKTKHCWTKEDLGISCRYLLGMSQLSNGHVLIACGDFHLKTADEGRDLLAEITTEGQVVWRLTREQLVDQIEGSIEKSTGMEEMRITNVHAYDSESPQRMPQCETMKHFFSILCVLPISAVQSQTVPPQIEQSCIECHDKETAKGSLDLTALKFDLNDRATRERWIRIHDRVEKGEMPPKAERFAC